MVLDHGKAKAAEFPAVEPGPPAEGLDELDIVLEDNLVKMILSV